MNPVRGITIHQLKNITLLKRVLEEVEKVMNDFKTMLFKSMEDPQIDPTNVSF